MLEKHSVWMIAVLLVASVASIVVTTSTAALGSNKPVCTGNPHDPSESNGNPHDTNALTGSPHDSDDFHQGDTCS